MTRPRDLYLDSKCPDCGSDRVNEEVVTESFPYGDAADAFEATFPVLSCRTCDFHWRDFRSEDAIESAMKKYLAKK